MTTPQQIHLFTTSIFTNVRAKLEIFVFVLFLLIANEELFKNFAGCVGNDEECSSSRYEDNSCSAGSEG